MDKIIYTSMTGAKAAMQRQDILSNNLANVSTNGFKAELVSFRSVPINGTGSSTRVFGLDTTSGYLETSGSPNFTGKQTDAMVGQNSWFTVQGLDGMSAHTKNGNFSVSASGQLITSDGLLVLSAENSSIEIPENTKISLSEDGKVLALKNNEESEVLARLKIVSLENGEKLERGDDGLFRPKNNEELLADLNAKIVVGSLESSNVNAIETMVGMITASRQFEEQIKLLSTAESNDKNASQLLNLNA